MRFQGRRRPTEWSGLDRALSIHGADQTAGQPWPIPIPEVPEHSVNPCLVLGTRNAALGGELAAQDIEKRIL
jgi:hypothetical protein